MSWYVVKLGDQYLTGDGVDSAGRWSSRQKDATHYSCAMAKHAAWPHIRAGRPVRVVRVKSLRPGDYDSYMPAKYLAKLANKLAGCSCPPSPGEPESPHEYTESRDGPVRLMGHCKTAGRVQS